MTDPEFASLKLMVKNLAKTCSTGEQLLSECILDGRYENISYITWTIKKFAPKHYASIDSRRLRANPPKPPPGIDLSDFKKDKPPPSSGGGRGRYGGSDVYDLPEGYRQGGVFR